jgi:hypothetical protein
MLVLIACGLIQSYVTTPMVKKIFFSFLQIAQVCQQEFQHHISYRGVKSWLYKLLIYMLIQQFIFQGIVVVVDRHFKVPAAEMRALMGAITFIFLSMIGVKYFFYIHLINYNLHHLRLMLVKTFDEKENYGKMLQVMPFTKQKLNANYYETERKLRKLRKIYNRIHENSQLINRCMSYTVLLMVFVIAMVLTYGGYRMLMTLMGKHSVRKFAGEKLFKIYLAIENLIILVPLGLGVTMILCFFTLFVMVRKCNHTEIEVNVKLK